MIGIHTQETYVPVVHEEGERDGEEGEEEVEGEEVFGAPGARQLHEVEEDDGGSYDHRLADLDPVYPGQDVDGIGTEHCQHTHVQVVEDSWLVFVDEGRREERGREG